MSIPPKEVCVEWIQPSDLAWLADPLVPGDLKDRVKEGFQLAVWRPAPCETPQAWIAATMQTGGVGFLDPPAAYGDLTLSQASSLLSFIADELGPRANLIQLMLPQGATIPEQAAFACGFQFGADLLLLGRECAAWQIESVMPPLRFEYCGDELSQVLSLTYEGTQDCPLLTGKRPLEEVINGYEATGTTGRALWKTLFLADRPVGCVMVASHPKLEIAELVYMGLVASARGAGLGARLLLEAERMTLQSGLSRMVIGVDAANGPARRLYEDAGYAVWEQKRVFLWFPRMPKNGHAP